MTKRNEWRWTNIGNRELTMAQTRVGLRWMKTISCSYYDGMTETQNKVVQNGFPIKNDEDNQSFPRKCLRSWRRWNDAEVATGSTQLRRRRSASRVLKLEGELQEELLRFAIPVGPKLPLTLVHFATGQLEGDSLVRLAGEEEVLLVNGKLWELAS